MGTSRWSWVVASVLLLLGAVAGGGAVREHWSACRGSMLSGSVLRGYTYGPDFGEACLQTMDNGFALVWPDGKDPLRIESLLGLACALLLALSWAVVVVTAGWSRRTRLVAGAPAVLTAGTALTGLLPISGETVDTAFTWLLIAVNVSAVVAFIAVFDVERFTGRAMWRVAFLLCGSTAVGFFPMIADYAFMTSFSDANWDTPPGTGYPTVVTVALLGVVVLAITLLSPVSARPSAQTNPVDIRA